MTNKWERLRGILEDGLLLFSVLLFYLAVWPVLAVFRSVQGWFQRHVYFGAAPFRAVRGPYVLVLRSFSNRMAVGRRIRRIYRDELGQPVDMTDSLGNFRLGSALLGIENHGLGPGPGGSRPDLTLLTFLGNVRRYYGVNFVGVSNGSSLGGMLRLVHSPDDLWFEAMKVLAAHAKAILVIPDDSPGLVREVEHVMKLHASKVAFLMPPSDTVRETRWDFMKEYLFEGIDLTRAWRDTREALTASGVVLPDYETAGGILRCHPDGSLCEAKVPWDAAELHQLIDRIGDGESNAGAARRSLRSVGLRLLRYPSPAGSVMDEAWYRRAFAENFHIRDPHERLRMAAALPWLGLHHADHIMAAPMPGERGEPPSSSQQPSEPTDRD